MRAVILAAGMGKRLKPLTENLPKALIPINGRPLIQYSLDNLKKANIENITLVVGFMENLFKEKLKNYKIDYITNEEFETTGSMNSLLKTEGKINEDILLLESDLLYEPRALTTLLNAIEKNLILIAPISNSGDEVFIHFNELGYLEKLSQNPNDKDKANGELAGITKLSKEFLNWLYYIAKKDKKSKTKHYEEVIYELSKKFPIKCLLINDLIWTEIDTKKDLERAEKIFKKIKW